MKISIITAVFNRQDTILRAIQSIKNQTYENIEIIVVDGGSTDNTVNIARTLLSDKDVIISEQDSGIYDALNKGIDASSGDVIGFLHSDDFYNDNNVISKASKCFANENCDVVYGNAAFFKKDNPNKTIRKYKSDELSIRNLAWGKMPAHTSMFLKKTIFQDCGLFNTKYKICGDYEFLCRIMTSRDIRSYYIPDIFVKMQLGGISTGGLKNSLIINMETLNACKDNGIYTNLLMLVTKYPSKIMQFIFRR